MWLFIVPDKVSFQLNVKMTCNSSVSVYSFPLSFRLTGSSGGSDTSHFLTSITNLRKIWIKFSIFRTPLAFRSLSFSFWSFLHILKEFLFFSEKLREIWNVTFLTLSSYHMLAQWSSWGPQWMYFLYKIWNAK